MNIDANSGSRTITVLFWSKLPFQRLLGSVWKALMELQPSTHKKRCSVLCQVCAKLGLWEMSEHWRGLGQGRRATAVPPTPSSSRSGYRPFPSVRGASSHCRSEMGNGLWARQLQAHQQALSPELFCFKEGWIIFNFFFFCTHLCTLYSSICFRNRWEPCEMK